VEGVAGAKAGLAFFQVAFTLAAEIGAFWVFLKAGRTEHTADLLGKAPLTDKGAKSLKGLPGGMLQALLAKRRGRDP
jgi:hypothetical protein